MSASAAVAVDRTANSDSMEIVERSPGRFDVRGAFTFATARRAREDGLRAFHASSASAIEVDCSGMTASDSAGLAVLLDWLAFAKQARRKLRFTNLPDRIRAVARISDVDELLERGV